MFHSEIVEMEAIVLTQYRLHRQRSLFSIVHTQKREHSDQVTVQARKLELQDRDESDVQDNFRLAIDAFNGS